MLNKLNQRGFASVLLIIILLAGIGVGTYLVQQQQTYRGFAMPAGDEADAADDGDGGDTSNPDDGDRSDNQDNSGEEDDSSNDGNENNNDDSSQDDSGGHGNDFSQDSTSMDDDGNLIIANQVLVRYTTTKEGTKKSNKKNRKNMNALLQKIGLTVLLVSPDKRQETIEKLNEDPDVVYAEANYVNKASETIPDDPNFKNSQYGLKKIKAPQAWDITKGDSSLIAVIDTGINTNHPDLKNKIALSYDFIQNRTIVNDDNGHGTHVAGIIAASTNNKIGIAGGTWNNLLMNLKVLDSNGDGSVANICKAIIFAVDNGAKVINLSLGGTAFSQALQDAVAYATSKGVVVVAAAGNNSNNMPVYPASYDKVLGVSAIDDKDQRASFSSFGNWVDLAAPGVDIYSTYLNKDYQKLSGTSMATPYVSAAAALVLSRGVNSSDQILNVLQSSTEDILDSGYDVYSGSGRLDIYNALIRTGSTIDPNPSVPPSSPPAPVKQTFLDIVEPNQKKIEKGISRKKNIRVVTRASDDIVKVEFYYDNSLKCTRVKNPFRCRLRSKNPDSKNLEDKNHIIKIIGYTSDGDVVEKTLLLKLKK